MQSTGYPMGSYSIGRHISDHSLSGHSYTFTFSSTEVRLSFSLSHFLLHGTPCLLQLMFCHSNNSLLPLYSQTLDDDVMPTNNNNQWQSRPVSEWNSQQVCLWLVAMSMDQHAAEFSARGVDGAQLLNMDTEKLKVSSGYGTL